MWESIASTLSSNVFRGGALFVTAISTVGGIIMLIIKQRPAMLKLEQDGEEKLRSEMWTDITALKIAKAEMGSRLTLAESELATQKVEIGQQRFILNLVITELENVSPGNAIARQARILMDQVQPAAFARAGRPFGADLTDRITQPGVGE